MNTSQLNGSSLNGAAAGGANAWLSGGLLSAVLLSAALVSSPVLSGGLATTPEAGGRVSSLLRGGASSGSRLDAKWFIATQLQGGPKSSWTVGSNDVLLDGNFTTNAFLRDGLASTDLCSGQVKTWIRLRGDWASSNQLGGDIVQAFLDPLLNTWALEIRSATEQLSLITPLKDI